jgi:hypothetical protein
MKTLIQIGNPCINFSSDHSWIEIRHHIIKVVSKLPNEYAIIENDINKVVLLVIPKQLSERVIQKDQIIYIVKEKTDSSGSTIRMVLTNEDKQIISYSELYWAKKTLDTFAFHLQKFQKAKIIKMPPLDGPRIAPVANSNILFFQIIATLAVLTAFIYVLSGLIIAMKA